MQDQASRDESSYLRLRDRIAKGFCVIEVLFADDGRPVDGVLREVNKAYEAQTGRTQAVGRRISELVPELKDSWVEVLGGIALGGEEARFEQRGAVAGQWYEVHCFLWGAPGERLVGVLFNDISLTYDLAERRRADAALRAEMQERLRAQEELRALNERLEGEVAARTGDLTRANAELAQAKERLRELSARLIRMQEQERGEIARDFHDGTGQFLALLRMQLSDLARDVGEEQVRPSTELVKQVIDHTRRLSMMLRPIILDDLGLDAALEWLVGDQASLAGWSASYRGGVGERRFADDIETACFRIAQEALTNAARSAGATEVSVSLALQGGELVLEVSDNGRGFDVQRYRAPEERSKHFGLLAMEERAGLVDARLTIESIPGRGTRIEAVFPVSGRR